MNVIEVYDKLHAMPEIGFQEFKTSAFLAEELEKMGYQVRRNVGGTGVIGTYATGNPGPTIAIRADMDALKHMVNGEIVGIHSCGHDAHCAMTLCAAADIIKTVKKGTVKILFQPAEELLTGALRMIEDGMLDGVDIVYGLHVRPVQDIPDGTAAPGVYHASTSFLDVVIKGKTAHGARPHLGVNTIDAAALAVLAVNSIRTNPVIPSSIKVTAIHAGGAASNAIPDKTTMILDVRSQTNASMADIQEKIAAAINNAVASVGATAEILVRDVIIPAAELDDELTDEVAEVIKDVLGADKLKPRIVNPGGEDFHFIPIKNPKVKTAYLGIGAGATPGLHDPNMCLNKESLQNGVDILKEIFKRKLG